MKSNKAVNDNSKHWIESEGHGTALHSEARAIQRERAEERRDEERNKRAEYRAWLKAYRTSAMVWPYNSWEQLAYPWLLKRR
jgi:hypothetical protein